MTIISFLEGSQFHPVSQTRREGVAPSWERGSFKDGLYLHCSDYTNWENTHTHTHTHNQLHLGKMMWIHSCAQTIWIFITIDGVFGKWPYGWVPAAGAICISRLRPPAAVDSCGPAQHLQLYRYLRNLYLCCSPTWTGGNVKTRLHHPPVRGSRTGVWLQKKVTFERNVKPTRLVEHFIWI